MTFLARIIGLLDLTLQCSQLLTAQADSLAMLIICVSSKTVHICRLEQVGGGDKGSRKGGHLEAGHFSEAAQLLPGPVLQPTCCGIREASSITQSTRQQEGPIIRVHKTLQAQKNACSRLCAAHCAVNNNHT